MKKNIIVIVVCFAFIFGFVYSLAPADAADKWRSGNGKGWISYAKKGGKSEGYCVEPFGAPQAVAAQVPPAPNVVIKANPANMVSGYLADLDYVQMEWALRGAPGERVIPRVKPGQIVQIDTVNIVGLTMGDIDGNKRLLREYGVDPESEIGQTLINVAEHLRGGHVLTGPVYIEGAEPGDVLEVRVIDVKLPVPYGRCQQRPGAGSIPDLVPETYTKIIKLDLENQVALFDENIQFKLQPFMGIMGVAPKKGYTPGERYGNYGYTSSSPPGSFAGNLDLKELTRGATLYIPVYQEGALFYTGDAHANQGDGEITVNGIETSLTGIFQFIVHKRGEVTGYLDGLDHPFAETKTHYIPIGLGTREAKDLNSAMVDATLETIKFLQKEKGMSWQEAYALGSVAIDFEVTQVVDSTLGIHAMVDKSMWICKQQEYWYDNLERLGDTKCFTCRDSALAKFNGGNCVTKADGTPLFPALCNARKAALQACQDSCAAFTGPVKCVY